MEREMMESYTEEIVQPTNTDESNTSDVDLNSLQFILLTDSDIDSMVVDALKKELKKRGLTVHGRKSELIERLKKAMIDRVCVVADSNNIAVDDRRFMPGSHWKTLKADLNVTDPNSNSTFHGPTENAENRHLQPEKKILGRNLRGLLLN